MACNSSLNLRTASARPLRSAALRQTAPRRARQIAAAAVEPERPLFKIDQTGRSPDLTLEDIR
jgi:hypothetical protein